MTDVCYYCSRSLSAPNPDCGKPQVHKGGVERSEFVKGETKVQLTGLDSNVFMLIGTCTKAMKRAGATAEQVKEFTDEVFDSSDYHSALAIMIEWFDIT